MRRSVASFAVLAMAAAGVVGLAPSASAGSYGCAGSLVYSRNLMGTDGSVWSTAQIYYSSANNGTNCAVLVAKKWAGTKHPMGINLSVDGRAGIQVNNGMFSSYAGPVTQKNTNGHCVTSNYFEDAPNGSSSSNDEIAHVACG